MRQRDSTWQQLAVRGNFAMETKAVINNVEYTAITAPTLRGGLLTGDSIAVGNCIATTLTFSVKTTDEIPKAAQVIIKSRLSDGQENGLRSQWMDMGTFWINQRKKNEDLIELECYDAMLKGNQPYSDDSASLNWPKPMSTVVARICTQMGVTLDSRTTIKTGNDYQCTKPNDEDTLLDVLKWIGEVHGGNWVITPDNKLRLIPLVPPPPETFNIVDYDYNRIKTDDGYYLVWKHKISDETIVNPSGGELINVPVVIGEITTASRYAISKITMTVDETDNQVTAYVAGTDTGYNLVIERNPYATQAICDALLTQLNGLEYAPFSITQACFDPCVEYGDWVVAGDKVISVLYTMNQTYAQNYRADIAAPGNDEIANEYPYQTPTQKMQREISALNKDGSVIKSEINQMQDSITLTISELNGKADKAQIRSQFAIDSSSVTINTGEIAFSSDSISIDSQYFTLTATGQLTCSGATINGSLRTVNEGTYITVTDLANGRLTLTAAPYSQSIHNNYDNVFNSSNKAQIEIELETYTGWDTGNSGVIAYNGTTLDLRSTPRSDRNSSGSTDNDSNIWIGSKSNGPYGYNAWIHEGSDLIQLWGRQQVNMYSEHGGVSIRADGGNIGVDSQSGRVSINGHSGILLSGSIYVDNFASGYQGVTGYYWTASSGNAPIQLNFRNGILVGVQYGT